MISVQQQKPLQAVGSCLLPEAALLPRPEGWGSAAQKVSLKYRGEGEWKHEFPSQCFELKVSLQVRVLRR